MVQKFEKIIVVTLFVVLVVTHVNLRDLAYIIAVAEQGSFSKAAESCFVSQPTLSNQIKKLEETLGVALFERTNKRVLVTSVGQQIIDSAKRIQQETKHIHEIAESHKNPLSGSLKIGAFPTISSYIFPKVVPSVKAQLPDLKLILVEEKSEQLIDRLVRGDLDIAILALPINNEFLQSDVLFDDEFYVAVSSSHPLSDKLSIDQEQLKNHSLLLLDDGHCLRDQALDVCHYMGTSEEADFRATSLETLRQMVKADTGITLMPKTAINKNETGITYIPFVSPAPKRTIGIVYRSTFTRRSIISFIKTVFQKTA